jgi:hypothetical protein
MGMVSQTKPRNHRRHPRNGQSKFITYEMEMSIPHSMDTEISAKEVVWKVERGYTRDNQNAM